MKLFEVPRGTTIRLESGAEYVTAGVDGMYARVWEVGEEQTSENYKYGLSPLADVEVVQA